MEHFDELLEQFEPMISSIIRKLNIYKNHAHFRQTARIALWQAWKKFDESKGKFSNYAYTTIMTTLLTEMTRENQYAKHQIAFEKDDLTNAAHYYQVKGEVGGLGLLEDILSELTEEEYNLLIKLYIDHATYEELSKEEGTTVFALKKRRQRMMEKIRAKLKK